MFGYYKKSSVNDKNKICCKRGRNEKWSGNCKWVIKCTRLFTDKLLQTENNK
jgi:hypothetical protein